MHNRTMHSPQRQHSSSALRAASLPLVLVTLLAAVAPSLVQAYTYLGCIDPNAWDVRARRTLTRYSIAECDTFCFGLRFPLAALARNGQCLCSSIIPDEEIMLADSSCRFKGGAALYYHFSDTNKGCRLSPVPLTPDAWEVPVHPELVSWAEEEMTMALTRRSGPRMHTPDGYSFGLYSLKIKADPTPGAVTAFYLTSDNENLRQTMHEIDFEFINAWPASASGGIWTNSFINGLLQLEQLFMPWDVSARTGIKNFDTYREFHEYTIDWQPTHMRWFVDGGWLDERLDNSYQMPYKKSYVTLSFWSNTDGPWGGNLPANHPKLFSQFQGVLKRVVCDRPGGAVQLTGVQSLVKVAPAPSPPSPSVRKRSLAPPPGKPATATGKRSPQRSPKQARPPPKAPLPPKKKQHSPPPPALATKVNLRVTGFIGCWEPSAWPSAFPRSIFDTNRSGMTAVSCRAFCSKEGYPLLMLRRSGTCSCSAILPDVNRAIDVNVCANGESATAMAVYYTSAVKHQEACHLAPLNFAAGNWHVPAWAFERVSLLASQNKAVMKLDSQTKGGRVDALGNHAMYGVYQVRVQPDPILGAVTSILLTDDLSGSREMPTEFNMNFYSGAPVDAPSRLDLGTYRDGKFVGGKTLKREDLQALTGDRTFSTNTLPHYYTIDWQQDYVKVFADGALLHTFNATGTPGWSSPNKPALLRLSMWSAAGLYSGPIASWQVAYSSFFDVRRVVCTKSQSAANVRPLESTAPAAQPLSSSAHLAKSQQEHRPPPSSAIGGPPRVHMPPGQKSAQPPWTPAPAARN